ncbi:MAG: UxaA family hydrolase [SAR324 cluster bacterium]|nr:UxaA family hydrolase [SAR324 cluster bacterium]
MALSAFEKIGRLPDPKDNSAIAVCEIEEGTQILFNKRKIVIANRIPLAHRFAVNPIKKGDFIYSWGQAFGVALRNIDSGEYLCNETVLAEFSKRSMSSQFPDSPNFENYIQPVNLEQQLHLGKQVPLYPVQKYFEGFDRGMRGVGTRNYIIILGTSVQSAGFVRRLADSFKGISKRFPNIDGVVPIAHTEGGYGESPNNLNLLLRTLSGFAVHPNVGAILSIDYGSEPISNAVLKTYIKENNFAIDEVLHQFYSINGSYEQAQKEAAHIVEKWLPSLNQIHRTPQPLSAIKIALQCGGSDAFSGVSGNPLAAWIGKEIIRYGGMANLAETDELIGAESYVLANVRSKETAERFLQISQRFKNWAKQHGHSAEGNPSGGNILRGLYNIAIKSIGAARKRDPEVRLDHVIEYGEAMKEPGFYFMDSPGNDPESIAGQVASGANLIYFVTGNGSITNFPFVPTIKIMTTTERFDLLNGDIDVNAGHYLDGEPLESLGKKTMLLTQKVLSGEKSAGEKAGHSQINIWRNWYNDGSVELSRLSSEDTLAGNPLPLRYQLKKTPLFYQAVQSDGKCLPEQIGLVLPTSLCSAEVAKIMADRLTEQGVGKEYGISRFVALNHTEGCGSSSGTTMDMYIRTMLNHLLHPNVSIAVSLEHGCEKTHNSYMRQELTKLGDFSKKIGWFSIQLDGGIDQVLQKAISWCQTNAALLTSGPSKKTNAKNIRIGILTRGSLPEQLENTLLLFLKMLLDAELSVIIPENSTPLKNLISRELLANSQALPTLAYGQQALNSGLHVMATSFATLEETMTGMGGCGVQIIFSFLKNHPISVHPMIPVLQVSWEGNRRNPFQSDFDLILPLDCAQGSRQLVDMLERVLSRKYTPKNNVCHNTIYQISRGMRGISL